MKYDSVLLCAEKSTKPAQDVKREWNEKINSWNGGGLLCAEKSTKLVKDVNQQ